MKTTTTPPVLPEVVTSLIRSAFKRSAYSVRTETGASTAPRPLPTEHLTPATPMGANVLPDGSGVTFRVWAPAAREVHLRWNYTKSSAGDWTHNDEAILQPMPDGLWGGYVPGIGAGERYMFYVVGPEGGTEGLKRDPYARELTQDPAWPEAQCVVVDPAAFPWHDQTFRAPPANELTIYQLHVGVWNIPPERTHGTFLDVADKLPYLRDLGINAAQLLPVSEFPTMFSLGYNGVDLFSPESDYAVADSDPALPDYLARANELLLAIQPDAQPYALDDIRGSTNQLKVLIDLAHLHGIAVLLDVVYNHAGGGFGERGLYFFDRRHEGNYNDSLYFTDREWAGGLVFAYWNDHVRQFLIDNALAWLVEAHADGFRYDEVSVIKDQGGAHGWQLCQDVTATARYVRPASIHIAECWPVQQAIVNPTDQNGAGFDATQNDGLREAVRAAIGQAAQGAGAFIDFDRVAREVASPVLRDSWRAVQCTENHDLVWQGRGWRIPRIADGTGDPGSWYVRSRTRVALGLTLTAAGMPHLFMGQEWLENAQWTDNPAAMNKDVWRQLELQPDRRDFRQYVSDLLKVRATQPGLRGAGLGVIHVHNANRILAFQRWVPGEGRTVVVVVSLAETTWYDYRVGFPLAGTWSEVFNSDYYDHLPNPTLAGNGGAVTAADAPLHGMPASASLCIPANSILIFTREG